MSLNENTPQEATTIVGIVADALSIGAAIFAFVIVGTVTKRQEETGASLKLDAFQGPPLPDFGNAGSGGGSPNQPESPTF